MHNVAFGARKSSGLVSVVKIPRRTSGLLWQSFIVLRPSCRAPWAILHRGAKSKAILKVNELPQGSLGGAPALEKSKDEGPQYPSVVQQAWHHMRKFHDCVVLTRVGNFYEVRRSTKRTKSALSLHAALPGACRQIWTAIELEGRKKKTTAGPVSMAGFPFFQLDRFLKILVQDLNESVAVSEEYANSPSSKVKSGGLLFDRRITRIITPGTLIDEKFMDPYENNYLLALSSKDPPNSRSSSLEAKASAKFSDADHCPKRLGLAWLDLSTGDFYTQTMAMESLPTALARIGAREIVIDGSEDVQSYASLEQVFEQQRRLVTVHNVPGDYLPIAKWAPMLESEIDSAQQARFTPEEEAAGGLLLSFVGEKLQGAGMKLQSPKRKQNNDVMVIDKNALRGLEIIQTFKEGMGGGKGSLLHSVRRTVTKGGTRLLKEWIGTYSIIQSYFCLVHLQGLSRRGRLTNML